MRGRCTGYDARTSTDRLHLRDALRGRCTGCDARTAEGDARSLYGMRCADLYGLVIGAGGALHGARIVCDVLRAGWLHSRGAL